MYPTKFQLDRTTPAFRRMTEAGFTFGRFEMISYSESSGSISYYASPEDRILVRQYFACVCGAQEVGQMWIDTRLLDAANAHPYFTSEGIDMALMLEHVGAVSVEHLKLDGSPLDREALLAALAVQLAHHKRKHRPVVIDYFRRVWLGELPQSTADSMAVELLIRTT